jgi:hypothetical protein
MMCRKSYAETCPLVSIKPIFFFYVSKATAEESAATIEKVGEKTGDARWSIEFREIREDLTGYRPKIAISIA